MRKLIIIIILSINILNIYSQIIWENDLTIAMEKAKKENKIIFVEYYSPTCHACEELEPYLNDTNLSKVYNTMTINYKMNSDEMTTEDYNFLNQSGISLESTPQLIWFDSIGNFKHQIKPIHSVDFLIFNERLAHNDKGNLSSIENHFNNGNRDLQTSISYMNYLQLFKREDEIFSITEGLFSTWPKDKLNTDYSYNIMTKYVNNIKSGFFEYWIQHIDEYNKMAKNDTNQRLFAISKIHYIISNSIYSASNIIWDEKMINKTKDYIIKSKMISNPDEMLWQKENTFYIKSNQYDKAIKSAVKYTDSINYNNSKLNYVYKYYLEKFNRNIDLQSLIIQLKKAEKMQESYIDKSTIMYIELLYLKKMKSKKFDKRYIEVLNYYNKYKLNNEDIIPLKTKKQ